MITRILAEQIRRILCGGDPAIEAKIEIAEIEKAVEQAAQVVAREEFFENYKIENQYVSNSKWLVDFDYLLSPGALLSEKYALLPEAYISMPKDKGVISVSYIANNKRTFITYMSPSVYAQPRSGAVKATSDYFYTLKAGKIIVMNGCPSKNNILKDVTVVMAVANDATITDAQGLLIISKVLPILRMQMGMKTDMVTDNNPTA